MLVELVFGAKFSGSVTEAEKILDDSQGVAPYGYSARGKDN